MTTVTASAAPAFFAALAFFALAFAFAASAAAVTVTTVCTTFNETHLFVGQNCAFIHKALTNCLC